MTYKPKPNERTHPSFNACSPASPSAVAPVENLPALAPESASSNHFGLNTWFLNDWDGGFAFVDAMKQARPWQDANDWNTPVAGIDALGWLELGA